MRASFHLAMCSLGLAAVAHATCLTPLAPDEPLCNPSLATSAWGTSHRASYAQASSPFPGPTSSNATTAEHVVVPGVPISLDFSSAYADGGRAIWSSPLGLDGATVKLDHETLEVIDLYVPAEREANPPPVVPGISGAYNALDVDDHFIVGRTSAIEVYADAVAGERFSPIALQTRYVLPASAFCRQGEDVIAGIALTWDDHLVFATSQGIVGVVPRDPAQMTDANLRTLSLNGADCANAAVASNTLETISNSIATDEHGGIYVVTSDAQYKFRLEHGALVQVWRAEYGVDGALGGVRVGVGSGSTPTLMGTELDDEKFVVITDGQELMHLVLMWRDEIPADWQPIAPGKDRRIACEVPVTFGDPHATASSSEQSVMVRGYAAVVVDNQLTDNDQFLGLAPVLQNLYGALEGGNPAQAPHGLERIDWDPALRTCTRVWTNPDISIPNGIPGMSTAANVVYGIEQRDGVWGLGGVDFDTGKSALFVPGAGQPCSDEALDAIAPILVPLVSDRLTRMPNSCENSVFASTEVGPDGTVYTGTFQGVSRYTAASPAPLPLREQALAGVRQAEDLADRAAAALGSDDARVVDAVTRAGLQLAATRAAVDDAESSGKLDATSAAAARTAVDGATARFAAASGPATAGELAAARPLLASARDALRSCPSAPRAGCRTAGNATLAIAQRGGLPGDNLVVKMQHVADTPQADFGDPATVTDYALCLYADAARALEMEIPSADAWTLSAKGARLKGSTEEGDGVRTMLLHGSSGDRAKVTLTAKGSRLPDVALPFAGDVVAQLVNRQSGVCWQADFAGGDVKRNDVVRFRAKHRE